MEKKCVAWRSGREKVHSVAMYMCTYIHVHCMMFVCVLTHIYAKVVNILFMPDGHGIAKR